VMLREWTPAGYVTRDYRNFAAAPAAVAVVTKLAASVKAEVAAKVEAVVKAAPAAKAKPAADKPKAAVVAAKPAAAVKAPVVEAKQPEAKKAEVAPAAKPAKKAASTKAAARQVSVNQGSEADLLAVKGLPPSVARAIIAARPFATLDEVCKAKGMGPKMLAKLRDQFVL